MDVRLSPEQKALRDSVAQVLGRLGATAVGQLDDTERAAKLDAAVTAAGWRELRAADEGGEPWASAVEVAVIAEQLGRGLADTPFFGPTIAAELRRLAGVAPANEPETVVLGSDLCAFGEAVAVDAAGAATALQLQRDGDGWSLGTVGLAPAEVRVDLTRPAATPTGAVAPIGSLDADAADRLIALGLATACADLVGVMQGAVDLSVAYAGDRKQYGQPVGAFQAVQHLLADALVLTEGSRSTALHAAWAVDALPPAEALTAASMAKAYAARAARDVCEIAIQVHGGIGNTWECLAHVFLRRALQSAELFGSVDACLERVLHQNGIG
jgi:alkylation response protein AidB-like acyl-CoA dehydrogenase